MKKSTAFYAIVRQFVRPTVGLFYRRQEVQGLDNIPQNRAVIFAVNHHNAFLDALVTLNFIEGQSYSAVRSDVFENRIARFIFFNFGMVPVYRIQDGYGKLEKNDKTFGRMKQVLKEGSNLLIFPEATHSSSYRLRPLRKGLARICADLLADGCRFSVVPVGLFFTERYGVRGDVLLRFGEAISSDDLAYESEANTQFLIRLTAQIEEKMRALLPAIPPEKDTAAIASLIKRLCDAAPDALVSDIVIALETALTKSESEATLQLQSKWPRKPSHIFRAIILWAAKAGKIFFAPLLMFNRLVSKKITDDVVFIQSLTYATFALITPIYLILLWVILYFAVESPINWIIWLIIFFCGFAFMKSKEPGIRKPIS